MIANARSSGLVGTLTVLTAMATFACSGIDGLPEQPVQPSDSGANLSDAATAAETGPSVDAGGADAGVDAGEEADASVVDAADATVTVDATPDATVDAAPCVAEDDVTFCTRLGKNCGTVISNDNCGARRTVASCGVCSSYYESCGGGRSANVCGCTPESDWAFCTRLGRTCGPATGTDSCGVSRSVGSCGGACPPDAGPVDAGESDAGVTDASTVQRWTFTNCGASGATGPTQTQCDTAYAGTNLAGTVTLASGIQSWQAPQSGRYRIVAMGAQGGNAGGRGALIQGDFDIQAGITIRIVIGQRGAYSCGDAGVDQRANATPGGGGGTFVVRASDEPLVVAAGGGGVAARFLCTCDPNGNGLSRQANVPCVVGESAEQCGLPYAGPEGLCSGSGGSFFACPTPRDESLGRSFLEGARGGSPGACNAGGFGGGAAGAFRTALPYNDWSIAGGGGGGGYSGGASGGTWLASRNVRPQDSAYSGAHGSGGGSFTIGSNPIAYSGFREGNGLVVIEKLP